MRVDELFGPGLLVRDREHGMVSLLRGHSLGKLAVPSGQLLAGDPHELPYLRPIAVPAGDHEIIFGANELDPGHEGAGLLIRVRKGEVARWAKLRVVGVDGAAFAFADAGARVSPRQLNFASPLGASRIHRSLAVARIGSDGGYPLRAGYDARGRLMALALTAIDPRRFESWPSRRSEVPPVDASDLDACLAWVGMVSGEEPIVRMGKTELAPLRAIRSIPADLRRYYAGHTPYLQGDFATFRRIVKSGSLGRVLPIALNGPDALVYLSKDGTVVDHYQGSTMGTFIDLRAWVLLSTISVHDLRTR